MDVTAELRACNICKRGRLGSRPRDRVIQRVTNFASGVFQEEPGVLVQLSRHSGRFREVAAGRAWQESARGRAIGLRLVVGCWTHQVGGANSCNSGKTWGMKIRLIQFDECPSPVASEKITLKLLIISHLHAANAFQL